MEDYDFAAAGGVPEDGGASSEEPRKKQTKKLTRREKGKIALIVIGSFLGLIALLAVILAPIIV